MNTERTAYLILQNGRIFKGKAFGAERDVIAEVVFTTGMTGYLETLTDKSYYGHIVVQTFPLIGNYGMIPADAEGDVIGPAAYIVRDWCRTPSNFRSEGDIGAYLKKRGVVGLYGIDTRALTRVLRENGVMNGTITYSLDSINIGAIRAFRVKDAVENVSVKEKLYTGSPDAPYTVAMMDFGFKENIRRELEKHGARVIICPYSTTAKELLSMGVDGVMLSNGPGDPADNPGVIAELKELLQTDMPVFGICLGHQLLALASGCRTAKLKYGHRGENQPVKDCTSGRVYITCQNHGYTVLSDSLPKDAARELFKNVNDGTNEGIEYIGRPVFSSQFHPEASGGPLDTGWLFDRFFKLMEVKKHAAR